MKLSLNQLQLDSYATQLKEQEITEIKGGTSLLCGWVEEFEHWYYDMFDSGSGAGNVFGSLHTNIEKVGDIHNPLPGQDIITGIPPK